MSFGRPLRTCLPGIPITHCLKSSFLFALSLLETYSVLHITTWTPAATLEQPIDSSSSTSYLCTNQCAHNCSLLQASNTWGNLTRTHSMGFWVEDSDVCTVVLYHMVRTPAHLLDALLWGVIQPLRHILLRPSSHSSSSNQLQTLSWKPLLERSIIPYKKHKDENFNGTQFGKCQILYISLGQRANKYPRHSIFFFFFNYW